MGSEMCIRDSNSNSAFSSIGPKMCYFIISVIRFDPKVLGSLFAMYVEAKAPWSTTLKKAKLFSRPEITVIVHFYSIGPKMCYFVLSVIRFDPKVLGSLFAMYVEAEALWSTTLNKAKLFSRPVGINKMHFRGSLSSFKKLLGVPSTIQKLPIDNLKNENKEW